MSDPARLAPAAHLHVLMRRHLGRVTDVEWLVRNREYADEIVRLALASPHPELHEWSLRLRASFERPSPSPARSPAAPARVSAPDAPSAASGPGLPDAWGARRVAGEPTQEERLQSYVGRLR